jgi:hypothetical protein
MLNPRYDEEEDKSRHAAATRKDCEAMEKKYGWQLLDVELIGGAILKVDCVFKGKAEFPKSFYETEQEDNDA